ncbi:three-Cys-motif partner protein TcmP [Ekhidna sp.]|uniref:three-Cys-motif partner protein TcmP n=1 Tax=Ekhidna sp. TaxID=2608089 RepID=UPI003C7CCE07
MAKDLFAAPFDDGTKKKLEIFREYLKSWLPTFTQRRELIWKHILIYDFFSGEGMDSEGNSGSPLIILEELKEHHEIIKKRKLIVRVVLNEKVKSKFKKLCANTEDFLKDVPYHHIRENRDFQEYFAELYPKMANHKRLPRLIFLDQNGIKHITPNIFKSLIALKTTDIIFYISSSYLRRFSELPEFNRYIKITKSKFDTSRPYHSHRIVFEYYQDLATGSDYYLAPFSIKKGANVYGLIFGSNHSLGIEKFLKIAWKLNSNSGDADFNIDEEAFLETRQMSIFMEENMPKKLTLFENNLKKYILNGDLKTNKEIYNYTFEQGCLPKHSNKVIRQLIREEKIGPLKTSYENIHRLEVDNIILK